MIGRVIEGEYRIDAELGHGAFGTVYRAEELRLHRPVALKMLNRAAAGEKELRRFLTEGRNLAALNHPHVVQIYRLGESEGVPYLVMEFLEGQTLRDLLRAGPLPLRQGLEVMRQVAEGLSAIHECGIVHRDLSTNNVMLTGSGSAKILDLGLARETHDLTTLSSANRVVGTIYYISPEAVDGKSITASSDIFSFGVILYEVMTGRVPFRADQFMAVLYNILHRQPEPLETLIPQIPRELSDLVARCLEKDPAARPPDMRTVSATLKTILEGPLPEGGAAPPPEDESGPRQTNRNPYLHRVMIKRWEDFYGRTQEVKRIFARLNATPPGSISIVGERRIGKSSLLNFIYARHTREQHLENPQRMVMVFLDLQQEKGMSLAAFVRLLRGMVAVEVRGRVDLADCSDDLEGIREMVRRLDRAGLHLAILLDEFESVTANPSFQLEFYSFLRYLANHFNVAYITSSSRDLQILCHAKEISDSPFFNIFSTMRLGVFREEDAEQLICVPSEKAGRPLAAYSRRLIEMAGLFPFFLQIACSHALEYLEENPAQAEPDFREIELRFYEEAKLHYRYIWEGLEPLEQSVALRLARARGIPEAQQHILEELERRSYVSGGGEGKARLFATTFAEFVRQMGRDLPTPSFLGRLFGRKQP
jgi:serine/threonine protein kinase